MRSLLQSFKCGLTICLVLSGCATTPPSDARLDFTAAHSADIVVPLLLAQAQKCWQTRVGPVKTGLHVASTIGEDGRLSLGVFHVNWARGISKEPFLVLQTRAMEKGTLVSVVERPMSCTIFHGCRQLNLTQHLGKWLDGDFACTDIGSTLLLDGLW